jgi:hypothetical protein
VVVPSTPPFPPTPGRWAVAFAALAAGVAACRTPLPVPEPVPAAAVERCNGVDDDADGEIDDGTVEQGNACATGLPGVCAGGTTQCIGGAVLCVQDVAEAEEICNGMDDDCDGAADPDRDGDGRPDCRVVPLLTDPRVRP